MADRLKMFDALAISYPLQDFLLLMVSFGRNNNPDWMANCFIRCETKHPFCGEIPTRNHEVQIFRDDGVIRAFHNRSETLLILLESFFRFATLNKTSRLTGVEVDASQRHIGRSMRRNKVGRNNP